MLWYDNNDNNNDNNRLYTKQCCLIVWSVEKIQKAKFRRL